MSNGVDPEDALNKEQAPVQPDDASGQRDSSAQKEPPKGPVRLKSPHSLERLRDRVNQAAQEIERLRRENRALHERIALLETRPTVDFDGTVLAFDDDPGALQEKIEGFIIAIDAYLAKENE